MNFQIEVAALNLGQGNAIACDRQAGPAQFKSNQDDHGKSCREG
jgi:hypothetical protein